MPNPAWKRTGEQLARRRVELDPRYANRQLFADERRIGYRIASDLERGRRGNYDPDTLAAAEVAYSLAPGSLRAALDTGAQVTPLAAPRPAPVLAAVPDLPAVPGDDLDRVVDEMIGGQPDEKVREALRALWRMALPPQERLAMLRMTLDFAAGRRPPPQDPPGQHSAGPASLPSVKISNDPVKAGSPS